MRYVRFALILVAPAFAACGGNETRPPATPVAVADPPAAAPAGKTSAGNLAVANDILAACDIKVGAPEDAPKFDLDSADVAPQEREVLSKIATCLTTGPLKGRALTLTGRADPRGEVNYNMALGASRAKSVSSFLTKMGVEPARVKETSRGELDAIGTDEAGWRKDRRVDIQLE